MGGIPCSVVLIDGILCRIELAWRCQRCHNTLPGSSWIWNSLAEVLSARDQKFEYIWRGQDDLVEVAARKMAKKSPTYKIYKGFEKKNTNKITRKKPPDLRKNGQSWPSEKIELIRDAERQKSLKLGSMLRKGINRCGKTINCIILSNCLFFSNQKIRVAANIISIKVPKKEETEYTLHGELETWWFQPIWKISVKLDRFPNFQDEQNIWNQHPETSRNPSTQTPSVWIPSLEVNRTSPSSSQLQ